MDRLSVAAAAAKGKEHSSVEFEWTNEKHAAYLHSLEVSFVERVFGCNTDYDSQYYQQYYRLNGYHHHHPPLDRYVPDSTDSTVDLNHAKQCHDSNPHDSEGKRSKKSKKSQTSQAQKAPKGERKAKVFLESVTGSGSAH